MNSRVLVAILCVASLASGCIIHDDDCFDCGHNPPPPARPGDVTFLWTFAGARCDQARDVYGVNITIPGEQLLNNGKYACSTGGVDGITLHDFVPGTYNYTLQAVNFSNQVIFEASSTFTINGDQRVTIDLAPTGSPTSYANLNWTFPGNQSCAQAGVASVEVSIDTAAGIQSKTFDCAQGQTAQGVQTPPLDPDTYFIEFIARASNGQPLYYFNGELVTQAYHPISATFGLYTVGGASISWKFSDGSVLFDCAQLDPSGNLQIGVNFQDTATGQWVYGAVGDWHKCSTKPIVYSFLRPGTYKVSLYAKTTNNVEYRSNPNINPVQVQTHVFPGPNAALEVTMYRQ
jgi:hypothetical protein